MRADGLDRLWYSNMTAKMSPTILTKQSEDLISFACVKKR